MVSYFNVFERERERGGGLNAYLNDRKLDVVSRNGGLPRDKETM